MIVVIDNYDSFTYNLVQYISELHTDIRVLRNDTVTVQDVAALGPERIVISPGPGRPEDAGVSVGVITALGPTVPLLGVCLGHQAIGVAFGGRVIRASRPMHGKTSNVEHDGRGVFTGMSNPFVAARYHSLLVSEDGLPESLLVTARTKEDRVVMGLRHRSFPVHGVQFHPESILTTEGRRLLRNFVEGRMEA